MSKVTCRYCKKKIDKESAICIKHGKVNWYYCNEQHANAKTPRDKMYDEIYLILGKKITNCILFKEFDEIAKVHSYEKILAYIKENYQYLCMVMSKEFSTEYAEIRYLAAIFKNNLGDFKIPEEAIKKQVSNDLNIGTEKFKKKKRRRNMSEIEEELFE